LKPSIDGRDGWRAERGWALVSVLWVVFILALLAAATQALAITSWRTENHALTAAKAEMDLDAAIVRAIAAIRDPSAQQRWPVNGTPQTFTFNGAAITVRVQDELGRIDLNMADQSLLRQLLIAAGMSADDAAAQTDKILDWRSQSDLHRLHGANQADYLAAGYAYHPRHGPFQTVQELKLVMGMTPELFAKLEPALTVYNHSSSVDASVAPRPVLLALNNNNFDRVDDILRQRQTLVAEGGAMQTGIIGPGVSLAGRSFAIDAELTLAGKHFRREVVAELTDDNKRPYLILHWQ